MHRLILLGVITLSMACSRGSEATNPAGQSDPAMGVPRKGKFGPVQ
jgi:hypothetical protein